MHKIVLFLLLSLSFLFSQAQAPAKPKVKILTWNIQMLPRAFSGFSGSLRKAQAIRLPWIVKYLKNSDYDVVVLEELFDKRITKKLTSELQSSFPYQYKPQKKGAFKTTNGICILSKHPMELVGTIFFKDKKGIDAMASKGCVMVEVFVKGLTFQLLSTHLQAGNKHQMVREKQLMQTFKELISKNKKPNVPQVFVGDFNIDYFEEHYPTLLRIINMQDALVLEERKFTYDTENTWKTEKQPRKLDYIFFDKRFPILKASHVKIIRPKGEHNGKPMDYADHYGLEAVLGLFD